MLAFCMDFQPAQETNTGARRLISVAWPLLAAAALLCPPQATLSQAAPPAQTANAQPADSRIESLLQDLGRVRTPTSVAISPDGLTLAWAVNGPRGSELHLTGIAPAGSAQDGAWERVIAPDTIGDVTNNRPGECTASHPNWSPDGKQLAFLSDCSASDKDLQPTSQNNIFVWTLAVNSMKQVSHLHGAVSSITWSPDGKSIAFLYVENATRQAGALDAMKPWSGVYGEDGVEVQRVAAVNVAAVNVAGTFAYWLSADPKLHVYEFSWSPDSKRITYVAAAPPGENNWWVARLYGQTTGTIGPCGSSPIDKTAIASIDKTAIAGCAGLGVPMGVPESILDPATTPGPLHGLQIALPRFSPDGKQIAFIGGLMSDQGSTGGDIYVIPSTGLKPGGEPKNVTPNRPTSPAYIAWLDDHTLGISEHTGGSSHIASLDLNTGKNLAAPDVTLPDSIIAGPDVMSISAASHSPNIAMIRQSFDHPPEVWAGPTGNLKQMTHLNDTLKPAWGKTESIDYTNDGFHIQGWLLYPAGWSPNDGNPAKKYPLIVSVHGGPSSAVTPRWPSVNYGAVPFSALGYFVFMPNPRGSFGQGEKFTQANVKDFGYGDLRDILAGVDVLEKRFPIDKDREGLTGWSYGGFMTMFGVTQTTRFKAAVAGAGISDWQSYYGENSIDQWMVPFFGKTVYDDPAIYAKSSAIGFIKNVKTPTLVVVGDRDGECPAPQSFEFWHALKAEGVKTQLVIYPGEGHHFVDPEHQRDVLKRALDWFETEMPPK
jgi:dipeptidyl aminopeptidase/acylaminoacyl peptidase